MIGAGWKNPNSPPPHQLPRLLLLLPNLLLRMTNGWTLLLKSRLLRLKPLPSPRLSLRPRRLLRKS